MTMEKKEKCCTKTAATGGCNEKKQETTCQDDKKCQDGKKDGMSCHTKSRPTGDPMQGDVC